MTSIMDSTSISSEVYDKFLNNIVFAEDSYQVSLP